MTQSLSFSKCITALHFFHSLIQIQFAPVTIGKAIVFGIGTEEVNRVGGPRHVSREI